MTVERSKLRWFLTLTLIENFVSKNLLIKVILRLILVQENYDQRAQLLTKDYKDKIWSSVYYTRLPSATQGIIISLPKCPLVIKIELKVDEVWPLKHIWKTDVVKL